MADVPDAPDPAEAAPPVREIVAVAFDWYATLGRPLAEEGWWAHLPRVIVDAGGTIDPQAVAEWQVLPEEHTEVSATRAEYEAWIEARLRVLLVACGVPSSAHDAVVAVRSRFWETELVALLEGARATVEAIRARGYRVAVCSNWDWDLDRHLEHNGIRSLFDLVVCSAMVGYRKPHQAIFGVLSEGLGVPPESILFVGDDLVADVEGAGGAGMLPVHAAWALPCSTVHPPGVICCRSFDELLAVPAISGIRTS
jgi:putative hydrolase of the HAD superfamily